MALLVENLERIPKYVAGDFPFEQNRLNFNDIGEIIVIGGDDGRVVFRVSAIITSFLRSEPWSSLIYDSRISVM